MPFSKLTAAISKVLRRPVLLYTKSFPFFSFIRTRSLLLQTFFHGGTIIMDPTVRILHKTVFEGQGKLVLSAEVKLGSWMSGARRNPILLQPRGENSEIQIGSRTVVVNGSEIIANASVRIGADCLIGARTLIIDSDFHQIPPDQRWKQGITRPVLVEDNVWIGAGVIILKGVTVGRDAVIGAGCVVAQRVPAGAIAIGNPMRIVGSVYAGTDQSHS